MILIALKIYAQAVRAVYSMLQNLPLDEQLYLALSKSWCLTCG